ncbi:MAG: methionine--tRNA ligase [Clostridia bacterium]|nr:methionine--tRNA ligase [Clostridia bacterium]
MCDCKREKFYITTAIPYTSSKPHFGNTFEVIMTDAIARYKRQRGYDVWFQTGSDEHGQKIEEKANEAGITPKEYIDGISSQLKANWDSMNTTYDKFIRTSDDYHEKAVANIFVKLYNQGDIYKGVYEGWYCKPDEAFYTDSQIEDGKCPECGRPLVRAKEEAYFFNMKKYANWLIDYINTHPDFILPESRKKEMMNNFLLVEGGLQDLCVTRSTFKWGIQVPFDPEHVIYVWLDALSNYITGLGYDPANEEQPELFKKYWPADYHIIGKDIARFHTIYWPIFLKALDLPLPKTIFAHPWYNFGQDKMSKSRGNVIYAEELAEKFTTDGVRYYALAEMPYANDGSITYESVITRYNNDLANTLGNLVKRSVDMCKKYFGGVVPAPHGDEDTDAELKEAAAKAVASFKEDMDTLHIADAIDDVMALLRRANKYIDETTPWALAKDEAKKERLETVIYNLLEAIRIGAVLLAPIIPETSEKIYAQLGTDKTGYDDIEKFGALVPGTVNGESFILFSRIDEAKLLEEFEKELQAKREAAAKANIEKPEGCAVIGFDDFMKVELRTAKVVACERIPKANKLLKLELDLGYEKRQVVSGIAKFYAPEDLIGKKLIVVANLAPAKLCGVESEGMILASGEETIRVVFLDDATPLGERVR